MPKSAHGKTSNPTAGRSGGGSPPVSVPVLRFGLGARSGGGSLPLTQTETSMTSGGGLGSSMEHAFGLNRKTAMLVSPDSSPSAAPMPAS